MDCGEFYLNFWVFLRLFPISYHNERSQRAFYIQQKHPRQGKILLGLALSKAFGTLMNKREMVQWKKKFFFRWPGLEFTIFCVLINYWFHSVSKKNFKHQAIVWRFCTKSKAYAKQCLKWQIFGPLLVLVLVVDDNLPSILDSSDLRLVLLLFLVC